MLEQEISRLKERITKLSAVVKEMIDDSVQGLIDRNAPLAKKTVTELEPNVNQEENSINVLSPQPEEIIISPLEIKGLARGFWFFEASFPVRLQDSEGNVLASGTAEAQADWMTEDFVPFKVTLEFEEPLTQTGEIIFEKDNPSDLPENAGEFRLPVKFQTKADQTLNQKECLITGCSGQLCAEEEIITDCQYRPEYECYKKTTWQRQPDGQCGWTPTLEFIECLENTAKSISL